MSETLNDDGTMHYPVREVVGVFKTSDALESAIDQLGIAGVDRAAVSVLSVNSERTGHTGELLQSAQIIADDPAAQPTAFVSHVARTEGETAAIAIPVQIGGFAGAWAIAAAGGTLITAIGAAVAGGAAGAALGVLLYRAVARHHAADVEAQLVSGGLVLWVSTPDDGSEQRALDILRRCGGLSVHTHSIGREWGVENIPLHDAQPDPFLEADKC